jgi:lysophospholipase L1-like esterase
MNHLWHSHKLHFFVLFLSVLCLIGFTQLQRPLTLASITNLLPKASASAWGEAPMPLTYYPADNPASSAPLLRWTRDDQAVSYQVEFFDSIPQNLSDTKLSSKHIYYVAAVFTNAYNPDIDEFATDAIGKKPLYWRVRSVSFDNKPISKFSAPEPIYTDRNQPKINAPVPTAVYDSENGHNLLYPVYSWIPNHGAAKFELEVLSQPPENPGGTEPSRYRIFSTICPFGEQYDPAPRFGTRAFYWRVRALDADDQPVGVYSEASAITLNPKRHWEVGIYGDSISHGGGHLSYGPADWEYGYASYLSFPSVNLSQSGDTSQALVDRFERDVLPFHPHYLLILGGSNSLRAGVPAESVIADLQAIKEKCLQNNIKPIFLTLPPINPANIKAAFDEDTFSGWASQFALVNEYIRSEVHIDIASSLDCPQEILPTELGLDGLHLDVSGKKAMADTINQNWNDVRLQADEQ